MSDEAAAVTAVNDATNNEDQTQSNISWMKYQAKVEVVKEVLSRRGAIPEQEARLLAECVNIAFDEITF